MKNFIRLIVILAAIMLLPSCSSGSDADNELEGRITAFLETVFNNEKIIDIEKVSEEELSRFAFFIGMYKGMVNKRSTEIGSGLTKEQIEENILDVFGSDSIIKKLNYDHIPADYDEVNDIYIPYLYGAPSYGLKYVIHDMKQLTDDRYEVIVSYIDFNAYITSFDPVGNMIRPDNTENEDTKEGRQKAIEKLRKIILADPEGYERVKLLLTITCDHISLSGAKNIN